MKSVIMEGSWSLGLGSRAAKRQKVVNPRNTAVHWSRLHEQAVSQATTQLIFIISSRLVHADFYNRWT